MEEIWRRVEDIDSTNEVFYEVSNLGRIRRISIVHGYNQCGPGQKKPRKMVVLSIGGKIVARRFLHRLVAKAFCHKPIGYDQVNHLDGNPLNNVATNLEWTTPEGNHAHRMELGLSATGKDVWNCKTDPDMVVEMRKSGMTTYEIAAHFGVHSNAICCLLKRRNMLWPIGVKWRSRCSGQKNRKSRTGGRKRSI